MQTTAQDLIERAAKYDPSLAADIRAFAKAREFGLVFEHNRPEAMRLYGKKITKGDTVHILAPRGIAEKSENRVPWRVTKIVGDSAQLESIDDAGASRKANLCDLVAVAAFEEPIYAGLREVGRVERGGNRPYQIVINGENYHALETLLFAYAGKADCIYIDPPYNSGAKNWKYNNDYVDDTDEYRHSKWLAFMERRLRLAKQLLRRDNSVLICAIDDKEVNRLGLLLEQVFPGTNIQLITTVVNPSGRAGNGFSMVEEYLFFIQIGEAKPIPWTSNMLPLVNETGEEKESSRVKNGLSWESFLRSGRGNNREARPNLFYPIYIDDESMRVASVGEPYRGDASNLPREQEGLRIAWPIKNDGSFGIWRRESSKLRELLEKGYAYVSSYDARRKTYSLKYLLQGTIDSIEAGETRVEKTGERGQVIGIDEYHHDSVPKTVWNMKSHNAGKSGSDIITQLVPNQNFSYPKSLYAVEDSLRFFVGDKPNALIIDFFSGSGTTAHAVMRLNHQDHGNRYSVCITNNEVSEAESSKLTQLMLRQGDEEWEKYGICEFITKPRIRAAILGETAEGVPIEGDYKFTDEFPMADGFEENAIFFDLTYQNPVVVDLDGAYEEVAPLLWMRAGCKGPIIATRGDGTFELSETYAILFDYAFAQDFVMALDARPEIQTVYVVTDDEGRYQSINQALKGRDVVQLYESYLRSFQIAAEGALI